MRLIKTKSKILSIEINFFELLENTEFSVLFNLIIVMYLVVVELQSGNGKSVVVVVVG